MDAFGKIQACASGATSPSNDGPEQDAGHHLAHDLRLREARAHEPDEPARRQDDGELEEELQDEVGGRHRRGVYRARARARAAFFRPRSRPSTTPSAAAGR
jgi:hypothetical protein